MKVLLILTLQLIFASVALGYVVEESLPYRSEPVQYWITLVTKRGAVLVPADLKKTPKDLVLSALVNDDDSALVNGVVVYEDGAVLSTPLHGIGKRELEMSSESAGENRLQTLKNNIITAQKRLDDLQAENQELTIRLRKQAGLEDVDRVYARISKIEDEIRRLKAN